MEANGNREREIEILRRSLQIGLGSAAFLAGLDKFTNLLTDWEKYLNPRAEEMLPVSGKTFMKIVGVIEMAVGLGVLSGKFTKPSSYIASAWLTAISGNLVSHPVKYHDIAVRDMEMALEAFVLARLTDIHESRGELSGGENRNLLEEHYPGQAA
jgi:uncharacterized membrane protein YphA (DoxX/SURF4 family)